jgi:sirohydrochlorin cobaltochelatase
VDTGVLVIAHGSRSRKWVNEIEQLVTAITVDVPVELGYLELVKEKTIPLAIQRLTEKGARKIVVIPLFITAGSSHVTEIQVLLESMEPIVDWIWCPPLEDHPFVLEVLKERILQLSRQPEEEILLLIGHGSDKPVLHELWESFLKQTGTKLRDYFNFKAFSYATFYPDTIPRRSKAMSRKNRVITLPLFLSDGYFTQRKIPDKLNGPNIIYTGQSYLPHPFISSWIEQKICEGIQASLADSKC